MAKYIFVYHGGTMPESESEAAAVMGKWQAWFGSIGSSIIDGGNPVGQSSTVHGDGSVTDDGGANPISGYSLIEAESQDAAVEIAKGCPILEGGGSVEVAITIDM